MYGADGALWMCMTLGEQLWHVGPGEGQALDKQGNSRQAGEHRAVLPSRSGQHLRLGFRV